MGDLSVDYQAPQQLKKGFAMMTVLVIISLVLLALAFAGRNRIATVCGISPDTVIRLCTLLFFSVIALTGFSQCSSGSSGGGSKYPISTAWAVIGVLALAGAVFASNNTQSRVSFVIAGLAFFCFLLAIGPDYPLYAWIKKIVDDLFTWTVLGLPFFAAAGIWGHRKTEGWTKSFLGFTSGLVIIYWLFLFYKDHPVGDMGFVERVFFPDDTAKSIALVSLAIFLFATWKRSKLIYLISFVVFAAFLGNATINQIANRYPDKLNPSNHISQKTKNTWEKVWDSFLKRIEEGTEPPTKSNGGGAGTTATSTASTTIKLSGNKVTGKIDYMGIHPKPGHYTFDPPENLWVKRKKTNWERREPIPASGLTITDDDAEGVIIYGYQDVNLVKK